MHTKKTLAENSRASFFLPLILREILRFDKSQAAGRLTLFAHDGNAVGVADIFLVENAICSTGDGGIDVIVGFFEVACRFDVGFSVHRRIGQAVGVLIHVDTLCATAVAFVVLTSRKTAF